MGAFIGRKADWEGIDTQAYSRFAGVDYFHDGTGSIPATDPNAMVKGSGRMLGAGGEFANRVYVNNWYIIGPFPGHHAEGLFDNPSYPPELGVLLDAVYRGKDRRFLKWKYVSFDSYPLIPRDRAEDAVYYGYTEASMDKEGDVRMWIGADDDAQVYLNDALVWRGGNVNKQWFWNTIHDNENSYVHDFNRSEGATVVRFRKGRNKIFFKLSNGQGRLFFSLVLTK